MTLDELRVGTTVEAVTPHATSGSSGNTDIPLSNAGFESDSGQEQAPAGWLSSATNSAHLAADYSEVWSARTGTRHLSHYFGNTPYQVRTYRTITGLATGTYTLKAWTMSNGPLTSAKMTAKGSNGTEVFTSIPVGDTYTERVISNISVTNGQLELGFESNSPGGADQWITVDDVSLIKN
jgi:arabinogalactan endo-1,4-beta-galactosidase